MSDVHLELLDRVRIASPCPKRWEEMRGDDKVRHCEDCGLNVTNISALSREEAAAFVDGVRLASGRVCVGFFRRADGTILTRDCPRGLALVRASARRAWSRIAAAASMVLGAGLMLARGEAGGFDCAEVSRIEPFSSILRRFTPAPVPPAPRWMAGAIACPSPRIIPPGGVGGGSVAESGGAE